MHGMKHFRAKVLQQLTWTVFFTMAAPRCHHNDGEQGTAMAWQVDRIPSTFPDKPITSE